jgi:hypothetical protein
VRAAGNTCPADERRNHTYDLRRFPTVILQHSAEPLIADDLAGRQADVLIRLDQPIALPLVVSLGVIMSAELSCGVPKNLLAEKDHSIETFLLDRAHERFGVGVQVRTSRRQAYWFHAGVAENLAEFCGVLAIAVHQQVSLGAQEAVLAIHQTAGDLSHPRAVWHQSSGHDRRNTNQR